MSFPSADTRPHQPGRAVRVVVGCLGALFFGIGAFFLPLAGKNILRLVDAQSWSETSCRILSSAVARGSGGETFRVDVKYEYTVAGETFTSERYELFGGASSFYDGKKAAVDNLPPGARTVCYVNPADSRDAVIDRGVGSVSPLMIGTIVPLTFVVVGGSVLVGVIRPRARNRIAPLPEDTVTTGPARLREKTPPASMALGLFIMALFWNGLVSAFVAEAVFSWQAGSSEWMGLIFMVPFVFIGGIMIWAFVYELRRLAGPRPTLTINPASFAPGVPVLVQWETSGNLSRVKDYRIDLIGEVVNDSHRIETVATVPLVESLDSAGLCGGSVIATIPADAADASSRAGAGAEWKIVVSGKTKLWTVLEREFTAPVSPRT